MIIAAKTKEGKEFMYSTFSAHTISKRSGKQIVELLNSIAYNCKPGEKWHIYEIDKYDQAYDIARFQSFTIRNGSVYVKNTYSY